MLSLYSIYNHEHVHTVSSVDITISVLSATLTVTCTASGGTVVGSSLTGPGGVDLQLRPVGSIGTILTLSLVAHYQEGAMEILTVAQQQIKCLHLSPVTLQCSEVYMYT